MRKTDRLKEQIRLLFLQVVMLRRKLIHKIALEHIGRDASPLDRADDVVGCVESVTEILVKTGTWPKVETGTYTFWRQLAQSRNWTLTANPQAGDIIISPTGTGNGRIRGHVGILSNNGVIMSNDSYSGKWMANYDLKRWKDRYQGIGNFPIYYFTYVI